MLKYIWYVEQKNEMKNYMACKESANTLLSDADNNK